MSVPYLAKIMVRKVLTADITMDLEGDTLTVSLLIKTQKLTFGQEIEDTLGPIGRKVKILLTKLGKYLEASNKCQIGDRRYAHWGKAHRKKAHGNLHIQLLAHPDTCTLG